MVLGMNVIQNVTKDPCLNAEIVCYMLDRILASYTPRTLPKLFRKLANRVVYNIFSTSQATF